MQKNLGLISQVVYELNNKNRQAERQIFEQKELIRQQQLNQDNLQKQLDLQ